MLKYTLITGASSGIGLELSKVFAQKGHNLILVSRDKNALRKVAEELSKKHQVKVKILAKDLTSKKACDDVLEAFRNDDVNILVNNAGFGEFGKFTNIDEERQLDMIKLNILALTHLTRLFLPRMVRSKDGKILNIASIAAFMPGPFMSVYYATKSYVLSFSQAINEELRGTGVSVTTLCPGPTATGFQKSAHIGTDTIFRKDRVMTAEEVAQIGYDGLMKKKTVVVCGAKNKFSIFILRFTPRNLIVRIVRKIQE